MKIQGLKVDKVKRDIREVISTPQGEIEIYEPSIVDIENIINLQNDMGVDVNTDSKVTFDGLGVIKNLFPILTNIDLGELSDEELQEIIENPSVHLLIAQQYVAQIVAEANKLYAHKIKAELMNSDSTLAQVELLNSIPALIVDRAKRSGTVGELMEVVEKASDELRVAIEKENAETNQAVAPEETEKEND